MMDEKRIDLNAPNVYYYYYDDFFDVEAKGDKCPVFVHVEEGKYHFSRARYTKAVQSFNIALDRDPRNKRILLARSRCYMRLMKYTLALRDIEDVLRHDGNCPDALFLKGQVEYVTGDFEHAYLTFYKGYHNRPAFTDFVYGLDKCHTAILNCIGPSSKLVVTEKNVAEVELELIEKKREGYVPKEPKKAETAKPPEVDYKARKILGVAAADKEFLQHILHSDSIKHPKDLDSLLIAKIAQEGLDFLKSRETFWQTVKPLHSRDDVHTVLRVPVSRFQRKKKSVYGNTSETSLAIRAKRLVEFACDNYLNDNYLRKQEAVQRCKEALDILQRLSNSSMPLKHYLLMDCYEVLGSSSYWAEDYALAIQYHKRQLDVAMQKSLRTELLRALRNVYVDYLALRDYKHALQILHDLYEFSETKTTKAYIAHEMGHAYLLRGDLEKAKNMADRALKISIEQKDPLLELNCRLLLAKILGSSGNKPEAKQQCATAMALTNDESIKSEIALLLQELGKGST